MAINMSAALKIAASVDGEQAVDRLNNKLRDLGQQGERSAKQLRQAYQQLPAQLQDVAVSLAGGQNPFMVLLQQGSQVSTQFGGIGNAIRGIASIITPARIALGGLAGALATVGVAAYQGYQESINLQKQIALTGNYAGMTADLFERAAARIQRASGATSAASREMLIGSIGSGAFGPGAIEDVAAAMTRLQKLSGQSTEDVVKMFSGMSRGVAEWSANTNRAFNFLSIEQYKYIKQLEDQGRIEEAMKVTANALNGALSNRTIELGYIDRALRAVNEKGSEFMNWMRGIGRQTDIGDRIKELESLLKTPERMQKEGNANAFARANNESQQAALREELEGLREQQRLRQQAADAAAQRASATQKAIEADRKAEDDRKKAAAQALADEKARESVLQGLRDEIIKLTAGEDELTMAKLRSLKATPQQIEDAMALIKANRELSRVAEENKNNERTRADIIKQLHGEHEKLVHSEEALLLNRLRGAGATEEEIANAQRLTDAIRARKKAKEDEKRSEQLMQERSRDAAQIRQGVLTDEEKLQQEISRAQSLYNDGYLIAADYYKRVEMLRKDYLDKWMADGESVRQSVRTPEERLGDELKRLHGLFNDGKISIETYGRAVAKAREEFTNLADQKSIVGELKEAIEGFGKSAADAMVEFAFATGKATESAADSFKRMITSVLQDIARMLVYRSITKPLFGAISALLPGGGGATGFFNDAGGLELAGSLGFANGGIMTSRGAMPLNKYARGGIANSPQLALFGEGRMPEAYVPLPDGRSIPVTMEGGGGQTSVVVNVNMESGQTQVQNERGAGDLGRVIAGAVKAELINQKRPGGLLAAA